MAKKKKGGREYVSLVCSETGEMNYRTSVRLQGGIPERLRAGVSKYCRTLRRHTLHRIKRK